MEWIETGTGNRISRSAAINGSKSISISDNCTICENCVLNGNVTTGAGQLAIVLGKYTFLAKGCRIDPPPVSAGVHAEVAIGNYTYIGANSTVRLAQVGNRVHVGANCTLGELSIVNDCCVVEDNTEIPPKTVIPPYSAVSGVPGGDYEIRELSAAYRKLLEADARVRHVLG